MNGWQAKLKGAWESARGSLWFAPAILVTLATILAFVLLELDRRLSFAVSTSLPWLFSGTPSAARSLLATIAGSVITVISIAFSLTVIAIQQASVQFTPRVLRTFTSDRGNQIVLGAYIATFVYSLLVLRAIRSEDEGIASFVPAISASLAIVFALGCMGLLIYFINHIANSLQASTIISRVHRELVEQIDTLYPDMIGKQAEKPSAHEPAKLPAGKRYEILSENTGFMTYIHEDGLRGLPLGTAKGVHIVPKVGDFVMHGQVVATVIGGRKAPDAEAQKMIYQSMVIGEQRTVSEDPMFAVRQLVDTALKGLSPGVNDVTTADYCIRYLGDALGRLAGREFPSSMRTFDGVSYKLYLTKPTWDEFVHGSFGQIVRSARSDVQVLETLQHTLERLEDLVPDKRRGGAVRELLETTRRYLRAARQ